jgi:hypothetical protein
MAIPQARAANTPKIPPIEPPIVAAFLSELPLLPDVKSEVVEVIVAVRLGPDVGMSDGAAAVLVAPVGAPVELNPLGRGAICVAIFR